MKMKLYWIVFVATNCILSPASAESLPQGDPRSEWHCAYPYTETNCQAVLLAWSKDNNIPPQEISFGLDCSGCDPTYQKDQLGELHLIYSKCQNRFGARITQSNFLAPINRYKESMGDAVGWNIIDWQFEKCFETWECGDFCSLDTNPPVCLRYRASGWGLRVPILNGVCSYGNGGPDSHPGTPTSPPSSSNGGESIPRDTTWTPVY